MDKILLVGFAGSGKTTVGEYLVDHHGYVGLSYADALKDCVSAIFCWDRAMLEGNTPEARVWREQVDPWWAAKLGIPHLTPRWMLRHFGTDVIRNHFDPMIWISNVERRILDLGDRPVVIFDGRFPNEIDLMTRLGGRNLRVRRGPEPEWWGTALGANAGTCSSPFYQKRLDDLNIHLSETAWVGTHFDDTIFNDTSLADLYARVDGLVYQTKELAHAC